jgi:hypothetical protein
MRRQAVVVGYEGARTIAFVKAMLAHFSSKLCDDQRRIFSVGFRSEA